MYCIGLFTPDTGYYGIFFFSGRDGDCTCSSYSSQQSFLRECSLNTTALEGLRLGSGPLGTQSVVLNTFFLKPAKRCLGVDLGSRRTQTYFRLS